MDKFLMPEITFVPRPGETPEAMNVRSIAAHRRRMAIIFAPLPHQLSIARHSTNTIPSMPWAGIQTGERFKLMSDTTTAKRPVDADTVDELRSL